jgi:zinc transport system permease protein
LSLLLMAWLAAALVGLVAGPLGCFVTWRRMAYYGDTIAHAALPGAALGLWWQINPMVTVTIFSLLLAVLLGLAHNQPRLHNDTLLGIFAHVSIASGLLIMSLGSNPMNLYGLLFGDLLSLQPRQIGGLALMSGAVGAVLWWQWRGLLAVTVHADMARAEGYRVRVLNLLLMVLIALLVALAMKIVGVFLITAMMIIPAATAALLAGSPGNMARLSILFGELAIVAGVILAWVMDWPMGPVVVLSLAAVFLLVSLLVRGRTA